MPNQKPTLFAALTEYVYGLVLLLAMAALFSALFWLFAPTRAEQYWYSFTNDVPRARVFVSKRPTDCYFDRAQTGGKRCHYEKVVEVGKDIAGNTQVTVYWQKVSE